MVAAVLEFTTSLALTTYAHIVHQTQTINNICISAALRIINSMTDMLSNCEPSTIYVHLLRNVSTLH